MGLYKTPRGWGPPHARAGRAAAARRGHRARGRAGRTDGLPSDPTSRGQALDQFRSETGRLPAPADSVDGDRIVALAAKLNAAAGEGVKQETLDEKVLRLFASGASGELNPMAAVFGGIVGQEAIKACSGKFHPLFQASPRAPAGFQRPWVSALGGGARGAAGRGGALGRHAFNPKPKP